MYRLPIAILALPLLAAAPDRDWYRICRTRDGVTVYMDLRSIEGTGTRTLADELGVFDRREGEIRAIRIHIEFDCSARTYHVLTGTSLDSDGDEIGTVPLEDLGFEPAGKDAMSGRMLAFACDPESSDVPAVEDPLHDEHAGDAPAAA